MDTSIEILYVFIFISMISTVFLYVVAYKHFDDKDVQRVLTVDLLITEDYGDTLPEQFQNVVLTHGMLIANNIAANPSIFKYDVSKVKQLLDVENALEKVSIGTLVRVTQGTYKSQTVEVGYNSANIKHFKFSDTAETTATTQSVLVGGFIWKDAEDSANHVYAMNGQTITAGATTYATLAGKWPAWVSGSDLVLPDWSDKFIRNAGTASVGTVQTDATAANGLTVATTSDTPAVTHSLTIDSGGAHTHTLPHSTSAGIGFSNVDTALGTAGGAQTTGSDGAHTHTISGTITAPTYTHTSVVSATDTETRPENISLVMCVIANL
jgi:hypothetical protein